MWEKPKEKPLPDLPDHELRDMQIIKQAILKSLIESGSVKERTPEAEKIVLDWVKFVRRNGEKEWEAWKNNDTPF